MDSQTAPTHVSSLLLRADPARLGEVVDKLRAFPAAEVPVTDDSGKIIVTLETSDQGQIVDHLNQMSLIDGVVSASMVYHQTD